MLERVAQPALAFLLKDFLEAVRDRKQIAVSVILGIILVGASAALASTMVNTPSPESGEEGVPEPYEVWFKGADGVLVGVSFGLVPAIVPLLPMLTGGSILRKDKERGLFQLSLSKPIPPWGLAFGKFIGLYAALAIPTLAISFVSALAVQAVAGVSLDPELLWAFVASNILLVGLYLLLTLLLGTLIGDMITPVLGLTWLVFNVVRPTSLYITARLAAILGADVPTTFLPSWTDLATFTGLYQGVLSTFVPPELEFVMNPGSGAPAEILVQSFPWAVLAWFVTLFAAYALSLRRIPNR